MEKTRQEKDSIGPMDIPADAYYGIQTARASENFTITRQHIHREYIISMAKVKKACAMTNKEVGVLDAKVADAIISASDEIIAGKLHEEFITDAIQGGAGTSFNFNANEVIANRAIELLGGKKGEYSLVHANDHVNCGQSTNDANPSAARITVVVLLERAIGELKRLKKALATKADEFDTVIKMGRTHLQDAVPIRLGQEFRAYSDVIGRDIERFTLAQKEMSVINLGGTAIGTGLNADINYLKKVVPNTAKVTGLALTQNPNLIDGTANGDGYTYVSGVVKTCAVNLSKMCNDMRLMSSGPRCGLWEINLPPRQHGSTIMPGKVNPVIPEVVSQAAFQIIGNDMTVTMAAEAAQFQINVFGPVLFHNLFQSIDVLANAVTTLIDNCLVDITANVEHCKDYVENSVGIITALNPFIGYDKSSALAKEAIKTFKPVRELLLRDKVLSEQEIDRILDIRAMTEPGGISQ